MKNKSCNTNLLTFIESIARSLHEKIGTDVIYFDFAKAFDTVSHDLILQKLKVQYKIDGTLLKLFVNYLQGRKQQVIIDNAVSNSVDVLSGVPQGSILGPLFFVLFINEIKSNNDFNILQKDIDALYTWSKNNKMSFHPDKCKALSTKYIYNYRPYFDKILPFPKQHYMINNTDIDFSECERDLGVLVNSNLRWEDHNMKILN